MAKKELTIEELNFRLEPITLNNQFTYWLVKSKCFDWNLKETNKRYENLRHSLDHATAMEALKRKMFEVGLKS